MKLSEMGRKKSNVVFTGKSLDRTNTFSSKSDRNGETVNETKERRESREREDVTPGRKGAKKDAWASLSAAFDGGETRQERYLVSERSYERRLTDEPARQASMRDTQDSLPDIKDPQDIRKAPAPVKKADAKAAKKERNRNDQSGKNTNPNGQNSRKASKPPKNQKAAEQPKDVSTAEASETPKTSKSRETAKTRTATGASEDTRPSKGANGPKASRATENATTVRAGRNPETTNTSKAKNEPKALRLQTAAEDAEALEDTRAAGYAEESYEPELAVNDAAGMESSMEVKLQASGRGEKKGGKPVIEEEPEPDEPAISAESAWEENPAPDEPSRAAGPAISQTPSRAAESAMSAKPSREDEPARAAGQEKESPSKKEASADSASSAGVFITTETPMEQHEHIVVPDELKEFLVIEDCSHFDTNVYMKTKTQEDILQSIVTARKIATMMKQKNGLSYPNTTLLYGPPGTGKTTLGRYVAYRMGMDFVYLDFSRIIDGIFGSTSRNISNIFQFMIDKECIFMLDELDAVAVKRGNESEATGGELGRITITIMQQFDYYRRHDSQAIIIAATNRADRIDAALRSRFSIEHEIKEMTVQEKVAYIENFLNRHDIPFSRDNIRQYSASNSLLPTRNVESDIIRCLVEYYKDDGKKPYILNHVAKKREF